MQDIFGKPWDEVAVEDVEAFLADAEDEGMLWEAKGTEQPHTGSVRKAVCGFANAIGGYYLIGAERSSGKEWTLPGVAFNTDEPGTWLSSVISAGVNPVPRFGDPKVFDRPHGGKAAVVRIEPVEVPPCMTSDGLVYQRVSGQTKPVTDPTLLADLTRKGQAARMRAETESVRAAARILDEHPGFGAGGTLFSVALCPLGGPDDRSALLFKESTATTFRRLVYQQLQDDPVFCYGVIGAVKQDSLLAWPSSVELTQGWAAAMYWTGAVAAVYGTPSTDLSPTSVRSKVEQAWNALAAINQLLGGSGETHVAVAFNQRHGANTPQRTFPSEVARRWTSTVEPADADIERISREVLRGFGEEAWEPETGPT